jgi:uncharacterized membrane protein
MMFALRIHRTTDLPTTLTARPKRAALAQRLTRVALMLTVVAGALLAPKAHADFTIKNSYTSRIWVAVNYGGSGKCGAEGYWRTIGWYEVAPGETRTIWRGDLNNFHPAWSYYAEAEDGAIWSYPNAPASHRLYVHPTAAFDICGNIANTQMVIKNFRPLYVGGLTHYTLNFTP